MLEDGKAIFYMFFSNVMHLLKASKNIHLKQNPKILI